MKTSQSSCKSNFLKEYSGGIHVLKLGMLKTKHKKLLVIWLFKILLCIMWFHYEIHKSINSCISMPPTFQNYGCLTSDTLVLNKYWAMAAHKIHWKLPDWAAWANEKSDIKYLFNSPSLHLSNYSTTKIPDLKEFRELS